MRYTLRSASGTLEVDSETGPLSPRSLMARVAESVVGTSHALSPTGPFVPVTWDSPAGLAAEMTLTGLVGSVAAVDEEGETIPLPPLPPLPDGALG